MKRNALNVLQEYAILSGLLYRRIDRRVRIAATLEVA